MYITAYTALCESTQGRLPVEESIESLYDHVDEFVVYDCSRYDKIDLSKYGKVRKHIRGIWNPLDNPFGSMFTQAYRLVDSDHALFLDIDEIFEFKRHSLKDLVKMFPDQLGAGLAFSLRNYYCSRNFLLDACSTKGMHVFRTSNEFSHDSLNGYWSHKSGIRRVNNEPDSCDGVRLCNDQGQPTAHYQPLPFDEVVIHHTSHLDFAGKMVRSILQYNHTSTLDLPDFYPVDMRVSPRATQLIYDMQVKDIEAGEVFLYAYPLPFEYEPNALLDKYIARCGVHEFDPTKCADYKKFAAQMSPPTQDMAPQPTMLKVPQSFSIKVPATQIA